MNTDLSQITDKLKSTFEGLGDRDRKKTTIGDIMKSAFGKVGDKAKKVKEGFSKNAQALAKEAKVTPALHEHAMGVVKRVREEDKNFRRMLDEAYAYAVFPDVARAGVVLGITYGKGEVFKQGRVVGYAGVAQVTIGVQLGGETFDMLVLMNDEAAWKRFKAGKISFAANASVAFVKGKALAGRSPAGLRVYLRGQGGEMLELALGGQSFKFIQAGLGKLRKGVEAEEKGEEAGEKKARGKGNGGERKAKAAPRAAKGHRPASAGQRAHATSRKSASEGHHSHA